MADWAQRLRGFGSPPTPSPHPNSTHRHSTATPSRVSHARASVSLSGGPRAAERGQNWEEFPKGPSTPTKTRLGLSFTLFKTQRF